MDRFSLLDVLISIQVSAKKNATQKHLPQARLIKRLCILSSNATKLSKNMRGSKTRLKLACDKTCKSLANLFVLVIAKCTGGVEVGCEMINLQF